MRSQASLVAIDNNWKKLAIKTILEDLYNYQTMFAKQISLFAKNDNPNYNSEAAIEEWVKHNNFLIQKCILQKN